MYPPESAAILTYIIAQISPKSILRCICTVLILAIYTRNHEELGFSSHPLKACSFMFPSEQLGNID